MSYDQKVILKLMATVVTLVDTPEQAYVLLAEAANVDGVVMKPYAEARAEVLALKGEKA